MAGCTKKGAAKEVTQRLAIRCNVVDAAVLIILVFFAKMLLVSGLLTGLFAALMVNIHYAYSAREVFPALFRCDDCLITESQLLRRLHESGPQSAQLQQLCGNVDRLLARQLFR